MPKGRRESDGKVFRSFDELVKDLENPPKRSWFYRARLAFWRAWKYGWLYELKPRTNYWRVRYFVQRGRRGWANCDVWNLDHYLARVIGETVHHLAKIDHGWPVSETYPTYESFVADLAKMADSFEHYTRLEDEELSDFYVDWKGDGHKGKHERSSMPTKEVTERSDKRRKETLDEMRRIVDVWPSLWD